MRWQLPQHGRALEKGWQVRREALHWRCQAQHRRDQQEQQQGEWALQQPVAPTAAPPPAPAVASYHRLQLQQRLERFEHRYR